MKEVENEFPDQLATEPTGCRGRGKHLDSCKIRKESETTACDDAEPGKLVPISLVQKDSGVSIGNLVSEQSLTSEGYSELIKELPPLARVGRHEQTAGNELCAHNHTGIKTWLKYAFCRTKTYCKIQLGQTPRAKSTKPLLLFRTFRKLDRSKTSSAERPGKKTLVQSMRLNARTWKWGQLGLVTESSTDTDGVKSYRRVVSCPA